MSCNNYCVRTCFVVHIREELDRRTVLVTSVYKYNTYQNCATHKIRAPQLLTAWRPMYIFFFQIFSFVCSFGSRG